MTQEEYAVLDKAYKKLQELYHQLVSTKEDLEVPLPAGLVGKVLVVDPKWNFVVIDIGQDKEVKQHGVMMVSRDGKLVAKVKIASVEVHRSIANIVPGWKLDDVMEGDLVIGKN